MDKTLKKNGSPLLKSKSSVLYWVGISIVMAMLCTMVFAFAANNNVFDNIKDALQKLYKDIFAITTVTAVIAATIALILRLVSRNQRVVDEATQWLKRIAISYVIINALGIIGPWLLSLIGNGAGQYNF